MGDRLKRRQLHSWRTCLRYMDKIIRQEQQGGPSLPCVKTHPTPDYYSDSILLSFVPSRSRRWHSALYLKSLHCIKTSRGIGIQMWSVGKIPVFVFSATYCLSFEVLEMFSRSVGRMHSRDFHRKELVLCVIMDFYFFSHILACYCYYTGYRLSLLSRHCCCSHEACFSGSFSYDLLIFIIIRLR